MLPLQMRDNNLYFLGGRMTLTLKIISGVIAVALLLISLVWFGNLGGLKERIYIDQIVKMRVPPERLSNPKTPQDYGMAYNNTDIIMPDGVRLNAWEIPAATESDKTIIMITHSERHVMAPSKG
ncbi:MAG: Uncharacterised protein [Hyphomonas sp. TMED17]|nr:MAG: Uncharacterised protein [Hyphomonas sp. TMED17]